MIIDDKELELIAVGISVAAGCIPCTRHHLAEAGMAGACSEAKLEAIRNAVYIANTALTELHQHFDPETATQKTDVINGEPGRCAILTQIGAAVARNSVKQLKRSIRLARKYGIKDDEILEVIGLANRIKEKAASHLTRIVDKLDANPDIATAAAQLCT